MYVKFLSCIAHYGTNSQCKKIQKKNNVFKSVNNTYESNQSCQYQNALQDKTFKSYSNPLLRFFIYRPDIEINSDPK